MAREGLRWTQYLVEPACTPSRAALMTGQYSIRNGLSLIAVEGSPNTTLLRERLHDGSDVQIKGVGYATAIFAQVAFWEAGAAESTDCSWFRRVLRYSTESFVGFSANLPMWIADGSHAFQRSLP